MKIEPGDSVELFSDQVSGCYLHGSDWTPHTARPGVYEVLDVTGETVLLGIRRKRGGLDVFRCSMQGLRAVVFDHSLTKANEPSNPPKKYTIDNSGMITSIYTTNTWGHPERVAEAVNLAYAADLVERANTAQESLAVLQAVEADYMDRGDCTLWTELGGRIRKVLAKTEPAAAE